MILRCFDIVHLTPNAAHTPPYAGHTVCLRSTLPSRARPHVLVHSRNRLYVKSLYRRYLTNSLNWYIRRDLWRQKAIEIRAEFERNRCVCWVDEDGGGWESGSGVGMAGSGSSSHEDKRAMGWACGWVERVRHARCGLR